VRAGGPHGGVRQPLAVPSPLAGPSALAVSVGNFRPLPERYQPEPLLEPDALIDAATPDPLSTFQVPPKLDTPSPVAGAADTGFLTLGVSPFELARFSHTLSGVRL
jgi:hypothetical protein